MMSSGSLGGWLFIVPILPAIAIFWRRALDPFFVLFTPTVLLFVLGHLMISRVDEFRTYTALALGTFPAGLVLFRTLVMSEEAPPAGPIIGRP